MTPNDLTLDELDRDGALREAADRVDGHTRRGALTNGVVAAGGVAGSLALMGTGTASAQAPVLAPQDIDILNFALTLEELEAAFYDEALKGGALSGEAERFAQTAGLHEVIHVQTIRNVLGARAIATPKFNFKGTTGAQDTFLATALTLEETGVAAYKGQAPLIVGRDILGSALTIHSVEAKHATWVRLLLDQTVIPQPRDLPLTKDQVLAAVGATGFIVG